MARGLSSPVAWGIFLGQGSNPWLLHWQADSHPLPPPGKSSHSYLNDRRGLWEVFVACSPITFSFPSGGTRVTDVIAESRTLQDCLPAERMQSGLFPLRGKPSRGGLQEVSSFQGVPAHSFSLRTSAVVSKYFLSTVKPVFWSPWHQAPRSFSEIYSEFKWGKGVITVGRSGTPVGIPASSLCQPCDIIRAHHGSSCFFTMCHSHTTAWEGHCPSTFTYGAPTFHSHVIMSLNGSIYQSVRVCVCVYVCVCVCVCVRSCYGEDL